MAASAPPLSSLLECSICMREFCLRDDSTSDPMLLACGHTFCMPFVICHWLFALIYVKVLCVWKLYSRNCYKHLLLQKYTTFRVLLVEKLLWFFRFGLLRKPTTKTGLSIQATSKELSTNGLARSSTQKPRFKNTSRKFIAGITRRTVSADHGLR